MSLGKFEKEEQELYFREYKKQSGISKNYGQNFYDLFNSNLSTDNNFHIEKILDGKLENCKTIPDNIRDVLSFKDKVIFDFGCGNGKFCSDSINEFGAKKSFGVDLATIDLKIVDKYKEENIEFISGGAVSIPLNDNSVDITTAFLVLEHIHEENIDDMFKELSRITKEGFIFAISHQPANRINLRRCSKPLSWWIDKIKEYSDEIYMYYPKSDDYKWGRGMDIKYSRLICKLRGEV